jgi:glyoxylase-like metal-dependent hydrolase (beta-lactamase superfamily II)
MPAESTRTVTLTVLNGGACLAPEPAVVPGGRLGMMRVPALFGLIEHPTEGTVLFDTGYHTRFQEATRRLPFRMYRLLTPLRMAPAENAGAQVEARGIPASEVRHVILSHFDPDHIGGLRDFPAARIVASAEAWRAVAGKTGLSAFQARLLPDLLPEDIDWRLTLVRAFDGPPIGPFAASHDLFEDGTIRLVELPGHAPGQVGAFVAADDGKTYLLAGDGCWVRRDLEQGVGPLHPHLAEDRVAQRRTYETLRQAGALPGVVVVPSHCPDAARELVPGGYES